MKKLILGVVGALAVAGGVALSLEGCGESKPDFNQDAVLDRIQNSPSGTGSMISETDYEELRTLYANDHQGDTTGFYNSLVEMLQDMELPVMPVIYQQAGEVMLPTAVAIYLDNTSSMAGYMTSTNEGNALSNVINALNTKYDSEPVDAYYINQKGLEKAKPSDLAMNLTDKKVKFYDSYLMYQLLDTIASRTLADSAHSLISFFITDAIPSFSSKEIAADREKAKTHGQNLQSQIEEAVSKLKDQGYGVSIYQFNGAFDGVYFDYRNNFQKKAKDAQLQALRPFYVIAIGKASQLRDLADKADKGEFTNFKPVNSLHAFTPYAAPAIVVPNSESDDFNPNDFKMPEDTKGININIPLTTIPEYVISSKDLDKDAKGELSFYIKLNGQDVTNDFRTNGALNLNGNILVISQPMMVGDEEDFEIRFKNAISPSFLALSTDDDIDIKSQTGKTFKLDVVANGLIKGIFGNASKVYLGEPVKFEIEKEN